MLECHFWSRHDRQFLIPTQQGFYDYMYVIDSCLAFLTFFSIFWPQLAEILNDVRPICTKIAVRNKFTSWRKNCFVFQQYNLILFVCFNLNPIFVLLAFERTVQQTGHNLQ